MLKIISQTEKEEDWSSAHNNNEVDDVSYSMVEDNAKKNLKLTISVHICIIFCTAVRKCYCN